jgi:hypothetical protein
MHSRSFAYFPLALVLFSLFTATPLLAQLATTSTALDIDKVDTKAFAALFRRENTYLQMAKSARSPASPEAHLDRVLPQQFELNADSSASLQKIASDWERDTGVLRTRFLQVVAQFHSTFPNGRLGPGVDSTPPSEIAELHAQMDTVTLQYRDKLRNAMQEPNFQKLRSDVEKTFAHYPPTTSASAPIATAAEVQK